MATSRIVSPAPLNTSLDRRAFLRVAAGSLLGATLAARGIGCGDGNVAPSPRDGGAPDGSVDASAVDATADAVGGDVRADVAPRGIDLDEVTLDALQAAMSSGRASSRSICEAYLARVASVNTTGPALRAVLESNREALALADALDAERRAGRVRGALHGVPVMLKGNIATADTMGTTAGSLALVGSRCVADSTVAGRLRAAGAVILAKTNLSEWANFRSFRARNGWSGQGGQCLHPYALDRDPSGSSTGSAVAVAANLAAVAVGTETDGSITSPSSANGVVGVKPTVGLVSRFGVIPISATQDTAGPIARTVRDAAILLGALTGIDARDPATTDARVETDYTRTLDVMGLRGARLGVLSPGLPLGLSFLGARWSEATLLRLAFAFEQATRARRPPSFAAMSPYEAC